MMFLGNGIHVHMAELSIHFLNVCLQVFINGRDVLIGNTGNIKSLPGTKVEITVSPGLSDVL